jgi:hypothetical protein
VVLVVLVVGWLSANEWGATTVGMWRWGEIHIHTYKTVRAASGSTTAVGQTRSVKKLVFVCEVSAGMRAATARALRSVCYPISILPKQKGLSAKSRIDAVDARLVSLQRGHFNIHIVLNSAFVVTNCDYISTGIIN